MSQQQTPNNTGQPQANAVNNLTPEQLQQLAAAQQLQQNPLFPQMVGTNMGVNSGTLDGKNAAAMGMPPGIQQPGSGQLNAAGSNPDQLQAMLQLQQQQQQAQMNNYLSQLQQMQALQQMQQQQLQNPGGNVQGFPQSSNQNDAQQLQPSMSQQNLLAQQAALLQQQQLLQMSAGPMGQGFGLGQNTMNPQQMQGLFGQQFPPNAFNNTAHPYLANQMYPNQQRPGMSDQQNILNINITPQQIPSSQTQSHQRAAPQASRKNGGTGDYMVMEEDMGQGKKNRDVIDSRHLSPIEVRNAEINRDLSAPKQSLNPKVNSINFAADQQLKMKNVRAQSRAPPKGSDEQEKRNSQRNRSKSRKTFVQDNLAKQTAASQKKLGGRVSVRQQIKKQIYQLGKLEEALKEKQKKKASQSPQRPDAEAGANTAGPTPALNPSPVRNNQQAYSQQLQQTMDPIQQQQFNQYMAQQQQMMQNQPNFLSQQAFLLNQQMQGTDPARRFTFQINQGQAQQDQMKYPSMEQMQTPELPREYQNQMPGMQQMPPGMQGQHGSMTTLESDFVLKSNQPNQNSGIIGQTEIFDNAIAQQVSPDKQIYNQNEDLNAVASQQLKSDRNSGSQGGRTTNRSNKKGTPTKTSDQKSLSKRLSQPADRPDAKQNDPLAFGHPEQPAMQAKKSPKKKSPKQKSPKQKSPKQKSPKSKKSTARKDGSMPTSSRRSGPRQGGFQTDQVFNAEPIDLRTVDKLMQNEKELDAQIDKDEMDLKMDQEEINKLIKDEQDFQAKKSSNKEEPSVDPQVEIQDPIVGANQQPFKDPMAEAEELLNQNTNIQSQRSHGSKKIKIKVTDDQRSKLKQSKSNGSQQRESVPADDQPSQTIDQMIADVNAVANDNVPQSIVEISPQHSPIKQSQGSIKQGSVKRAPDASIGQLEMAVQQAVEEKSYVEQLQTPPQTQHQKGPSNLTQPPMNMSEMDLELNKEPLNNKSAIIPDTITEHKIEEGKTNLPAHSVQPPDQTAESHGQVITRRPTGDPNNRVSTSFTQGKKVELIVPEAHPPIVLPEESVNLTSQKMSIAPESHKVEPQPLKAAAVYQPKPVQIQEPEVPDIQETEPAVVLETQPAVIDEPEPNVLPGSTIVQPQPQVVQPVIQEKMSQKKQTQDRDPPAAGAPPVAESEKIVNLCDTQCLPAFEAIIKIRSELIAMEVDSDSEKEDTDGYLSEDIDIKKYQLAIFNSNKMNVDNEKEVEKQSDNKKSGHSPPQQSEDKSEKVRKSKDKPKKDKKDDKDKDSDKDKPIEPTYIREPYESMTHEQIKQSMYLSQRGLLYQVRTLQQKKGHKFLIQNSDNNLYEYLQEHREIVHIDKTGIFEINHPKKIYFEIFVIILAIYNCFGIPLEICFQPVSMEATEFMVLNSIIDLIFGVDIYVQFKTTFYDPLSGDEVFDKRVIFWTYLKGRFIVDFMATVPFDNITYAITRQRISILPLFSLLKLIRITRLGRIIERMNVREHIKLMMKLSQIIFMLIMFIHCQACAWFYIVSLSKDWTAPLDGIDPNNDLYNDSTVRKYLISVYYSILLLTCNDITPKGQWKIFFCASAVTLGAIINSIIFGNMALIIQNLNQKNSEFQESIDLANTAMKNMDMPKELQQDVVSYLQYTQQSQNGQQEFEYFYGCLSPTLRNEVIQLIFKEVTYKCQLFEKNKALIDFFIKSLQLMLLDPEYPLVNQGEKDNRFFFIKSGECEVYVKDPITKRDSFVRTLKGGNFFGEVSLLTGQQRTASVRPKIYAMIGFFQEQKFEEMVFMFPEVRSALQKHFFTYNDINRQWQREMLKNIQFMLYLPWDILDEMTISLSVDIFDENQEIFKQGQVSDKVYILSRGKIEIFLTIPEGELFLDLITEPGSVLSQISILNRMKLTYSARAKEDTEMLSISYEKLQEQRALNHMQPLNQEIEKYFEKTINPLDLGEKHNLICFLDYQKKRPKAQKKMTPEQTRKVLRDVINRQTMICRFQYKKDNILSDLIAELKKMNMDDQQKSLNKMKELVKSIAPIIVSKLKKLVSNRIKQVHQESLKQNQSIKNIHSIIQLINDQHKQKQQSLPPTDKKAKGSKKTSEDDTGKGEKSPNKKYGVNKELQGIEEKDEENKSSDESIDLSQVDEEY